MALTEAEELELLELEEQLGAAVQGDPLPSEQISAGDRINNFLISAGREFAEVGSFLRESAMRGLQAETAGNFSIPEEARERISGDLQKSIDRELSRMLQSGEAVEQVRAETPIAAGAGEIVGEAASLPLGGPTRSVAQRVGSAVAQGALSGAVDPGAPEQRARGALQGAAIGAGAGGVGEVVGAAVRRGVNAGNIDNEVISAGEREGVPVFFPDVSSSGSARRIDTLNENVPVVGSERGRLRQNRAARAAGERRVAGLEQELRNLGGDPDALFDTIQGGLQERLNRVKGQARTLFNGVTRNLDPAGGFEPSRFRDFCQKRIEAEQKRGSRANQDVIDSLQSFLDAPEVARGGVFSAMRGLRSDLGDEVSAFFTGENVNIGKKGVDALQQAKEALERDMEEFAFKTDKRAWRKFKEANEFYREKVVPFKQRGLRELVKTEEPEKAFRFLLSSGVPESRSVRMYRALTPKGRAAVRLGLVRDAIQEASGEASFSTATVARMLEKRSNAIETFFQGAERSEIEGFAKLMRAIQRSGQVAENPPTGNRLAQFLLGGFTIGVSPQAAAGVAAGSAALTTMFQTKTGRNILLASAKASEGSRVFDDIIGRAERLVARTAGRDGVGEEQPQQSVALPQPTSQ